MRRARTVLFVVAISSAWLSAATQPQLRGPIPAEFIATIDRALKAYSSGDDQAVEALFRTREGIMSTPALGAVFGRPAEWTRARAAFLAEVVVAAPLSNPGKLTAIQLGQALALSRPELPGANPSDDRVEVLVHQIALAVYQDMKVYQPQLDYLDAIAPRFDEAARRGGALETRFPLARAVAAAGVCCPPRNDPNRTETSESRSVRAFDDAVVLFDRAARDPKLAAEARIRGAALQFSRGRPADAIAWLDRIDPEPEDKLLRYAQWLTRARALDMLNQPEASAAAYEAARGESPTAQTPAIGKAAALMRSGHTAEAARVATAARRLPPEAPDPWAEFAKADARFIKLWLAELRTLRK